MEEPLYQVESIENGAYCYNPPYKKYIINFDSVKTIDDIKIVLAAMNMLFHVYLCDKKTDLEKFINSNQHLFIEVKE